MASTPTPKVVAQEMPYQPGFGVIQAAVTRPAPISAAAGASGAGSARGAATMPSDHTRLTVRMDNGRIQHIDMPSAEFKRDFRVGSRVELTQNGFIKQA